MKIAIFGCGSLYVQNKDNYWLFGAPQGILSSIEDNGLEFPGVVFTTKLKCSGMKELNGNGAFLSFKSKPLRIEELSAVTIEKKHGTDYAIESPYGSVLFSERGDVSAEDTEGYDLAVIRNKHRSDSMGENVITWPWPDIEYTFGPDEVVRSEKVWKSLSDVPSNVKNISGTPLTLSQANFIARIAKQSADGPDENFAIGISAFKKTYVKKGDVWEKRNKDFGMGSEREYSRFEQDQVNYVEDGGTDVITLCGNCRFFIQGNSCKLVIGDILPGAFCDLWELGGPASYKQGEIKGDDVVSLGNTDRKLGDILIANLHTAYNDTADQFFRDGLIDQEERMGIAGAIGDALDAFRKKLPKDVNERILAPTDKGDLVALPSSFKEYSPDLPESVPGGWLHAFKDVDGNWRWISVTSKSAWDKHDQRLTTEAMDWSIKFSDMLGMKGPLRFRHIPGLDGGVCDKQVRVGDYLLETGTYDHSSLGTAMRKLVSADTDGVWRMSPGMAYTKKDLTEDGIYKRVLIFERSMTDDPAVVTTLIQNLEV